MDQDDTYHFTHINGDNTVDLLIGRFSGQLDYFENKGGAVESAFRLSQEGFYNIAADFERKFLTVSVTDTDGDGKEDLITGDQRGYIYYYPDFKNSMSNPVDPTLLPIENTLNPSGMQNFGNAFFLSFSRLYVENKSSLLVGSINGGVRVLKNSVISSGPGPEGSFNLLVYPNPATGGRITVSSNLEAEVQILNLIGQPISTSYPILPGVSITYDMQTLPAGMYLVSAVSKSGQTTTSQLVVTH